MSMVGATARMRTSKRRAGCSGVGVRGDRTPRPTHEWTRPSLHFAVAFPTSSGYTLAITVLGSRVMSLNYLPFLLFILLAVACSSGSGKKDEPADPSADTSDASDGRTINAEKNGLTMFIPNSGLEGSTEASIEQTDPEKVHTALDDLDLPIELPEGSTVLASMNISLGKSGETFKVKAQI